MAEHFLWLMLRFLGMRARIGEEGMERREAGGSRGNHNMVTRRKQSKIKDKLIHLLRLICFLKNM